MTQLKAALVEMAVLLEELHIPYMLIGGLAVAQWGEPRATLDIDLTLWVETEQFESVVKLLAARLPTRTAFPLEFAQKNGVLPVKASNGIPVDLLFARWPGEKRALENAVVRKIAGIDIRVAPLDYLLFLKLISDRPKDFADAEALFRHHRGAIDVAWLRGELSALADAIAQPDMLARFERMLGDK